jgi:hypothetical protein
MDNVIEFQTSANNYDEFVDEILKNDNLLTDILCRLSIYRYVIVNGYQVVKYYENINEYEEEEKFSIEINTEFIKENLELEKVIELLCGVEK